MGSYTKTGPFTNGGSPGISASFLNNVENALVSGGMIYFMGTPYHLYTNPTLNSGTTRSDAVTGGSTGVPTGALGVIMAIGIFANTAGGYVQIYPAGGTAGQQPGLMGAVASQYTLGMAIVQVGSGGQITVKANGSNIVLQDWWIYAYIM